MFRISIFFLDMQIRVCFLYHFFVASNIQLQMNNQLSKKLVQNLWNILLWQAALLWQMTTNSSSIKRGKS